MQNEPTDCPPQLHPASPTTRRRQHDFRDEFTAQLAATTAAILAGGGIGWLCMQALTLLPDLLDESSATDPPLRVLVAGACFVLATIVVAGLMALLWASTVRRIVLDLVREHLERRYQNALPNNQICSQTKRSEISLRTTAPSAPTTVRDVTIE
jgi:hypothetical protein